MPTRADVIAYLAHAGLNADEVNDAVEYLTTFDTNAVSDRSREAINYLGAAGLDKGGVDRAVNYLRTGEDVDWEALSQMHNAGMTSEQIRALDPANQAPAKSALAQDPAHLAFLRALGLEDQEDAATTQQNVDAMNRRAGLALTDLAESGIRSRQQIADSREARGLWRSGERLRAQSDQQAQEARQASQISAGVATDTAALTQQLAQRRAERERRRAEVGFSTAGNTVAGSGY